MRSGSRVCFHQTFYLLFPRANCSSRSSSDRFGRRNINRGIKETNRRQQCRGNKHHTASREPRLCVEDWGRIVCPSVDMSLCTITFMCRHLCTYVCSPDYISSPGACRCRRCCIPAWTTDRDFHSRRPADGVYMCQPLQQITNPPQQKQNFPLSFCNFQEEGEAVGHSR